MAKQPRSDAAYTTYARPASGLGNCLPRSSWPSSKLCERSRVCGLTAHCRGYAWERSGIISCRIGPLAQELFGGQRLKGRHATNNSSRPLTTPACDLARQCPVSALPRGTAVGQGRDCLGPFGEDRIKNPKPPWRPPAGERGAWACRRPMPRIHWRSHKGRLVRRAAYAAARELAERAEPPSHLPHAARPAIRVPWVRLRSWSYRSHCRSR